MNLEDTIFLPDIVPYLDTVSELGIFPTLNELTLDELAQAIRRHYVFDAEDEEEPW